MVTLAVDVSKTDKLKFLVDTGADISVVRDSSLSLDATSNLIT
jgi:hypothetical protein